ncbi:MAG: hypothetical protein ING69_11295 [Rhodocyclaceae bacterium]|nr:hypothetical protein [Rhodocyclaceae bacterium]MCA3083229.1 hypothetical protein [Rhodocyclaceae bacterium]
MTLDQQIQVWNVIGTWLAGVATFAAVVVSLRLARKADSIQLQTNAGVRLVFAGDGTPAEEHVGISAVNRGDRPVTINSIGWRIGRGKSARHCIQPVYGQYTHQYPKQLAHGDQASFLVSFTAMPDWPKDFATGFVQDLRSRNPKTLRAVIHTSVGEPIEVVPENNLLVRLRKAAG